MKSFGTYTCSSCGKEHDNWPALGYSSPAFYDNLSSEEQEKCELSDDFCITDIEGQTNRFIRCTLTQQVNDHCEDLEYGVWVSLSEASFKDYYDNYDNENHVTTYFGWLSSNLIGYEDTLIIPTNVNTRKGNDRPEVIPHKDHDHPFVRDYYNGISKEEAELRIKEMIAQVS
jgi:hypothetical protein